MSDKTTPANGDTTKSAAARLFDIRVLIGGLFTLYGVMLIVAGLFTSDSQLKKASNININLWLGMGMLALGLFFLLWWRVNPLKTGEPDEDDVTEPRHD